MKNFVQIILIGWGVPLIIAGLLSPFAALTVLLMGWGDPGGHLASVATIALTGAISFCAGAFLLSAAGELE